MDGERGDGEVGGDLGEEGGDQAARRGHRAAGGEAARSQGGGGKFGRVEEEEADCGESETPPDHGEPGGEGGREWVGSETH